MQAIMETLFDTVYLFTVITLGIIMIRKSAGNKQYMLFGIMAVVLGLGDSFHLVPQTIRFTIIFRTIWKEYLQESSFGFWLNSNIQHIR